MDATDARHREVITTAWADYGDPRQVTDIEELSAMVSTNRVYRLALDDGSHVIAKSSNYGSFFLFAEDHERLHRVNQLLHGGPFEAFLANVLTTDGRPYLWYDGEMWAVFYEEVTVKALDFMTRAKQSGKPFFLWWNSTRMHVFTHLKAASQGKTGLGIYADGMTEHDGHVGQVLAKLKELGLEDNTIVMYSTDNGAEMMSWPDGGTTVFRGEKNTSWVGGYRVPTLIKWPGVIKPGTIINNIGSHEDMLPTLLAAVGDATVKEDLKKGRTVGGTKYKVHLDGYNLLPALKGEAEWPRREFLYWTDDGNVAALRYDQWKMLFLEQRAHGFDVWQEPFVTLRLPKLFNLRADPFERADKEGMGYAQWRIDRAFLIAPAGAYVAQWLQSFKEFPPRQKPGSFNLDRVMEAVTSGSKQ